MKRLEFDEKHNLTDVLESIKKDTSSEIEVFIFPGSDILKDSANQDIIQLLAEKLGKKVIIKGDGIQSAPLIAAGAIAVSADNLGFIEGQDIAEIQKTADTPEKPKSSRFSKLFKLPDLKFLKGKKWLYFGAGFIGLTIILIIGLFWLVPSAKITLITEKKFQDSELLLVASLESTQVDKEKGVIPLKTIDTTKEDAVTKKATGTKTVGTNAKGRVKIINRDTSEKKFFSGTQIKTLSGKTLLFTLDESATLSAAPIGCTNDCPEKAVNVTSVQIGEDSNLKSGTKFQVGSVVDTTNVVSESLTNFQGGSSKKVTVVSADDQIKAKEELLEKMEKEATEEFESENPDIVIPEGGLENKILNETFSKKVGEEASDFRLSLEVKFTAKIFSEEDLKTLLVKTVEDTIPTGFEVDEKNSIVSGEIIESGETDLKVMGKIEASLIPIVNKKEIIRNISGKDFGTTDKYLKSINSVSGFEIKLSPPFYKFFGTMPYRGNQIDIIVKQKQ